MLFNLSPYGHVRKITRIRVTTKELKKVRNVWNFLLVFRLSLPKLEGLEGANSNTFILGPNKEIKTFSSFPEINSYWATFCPFFQWAITIPPVKFGKTSSTDGY